MEESLEAMLVVEQGSSEVSVIPLGKASHVLGSLPSADTTLDNPYVSRRHAEIRYLGDRYQVWDLGSKNGTFVNGSRLGSAGEWIHYGDIIELGRGQVILRFQEWRGTITLSSPGEEASPGTLLVNAQSREIQVGGRLLEPRLSPREFDVLHLLHERRNQACTKDEIGARAWPERRRGDISDQDVEQCIRRLRLRLEPDPSQPCFILDVRGHRYKLARG